MAARLGCDGVMKWESPANTFQAAPHLDRHTPSHSVRSGKVACCIHEAHSKSRNTTICQNGRLDIEFNVKERQQVRKTAADMQ